jgi:hypothetical protein
MVSIINHLQYTHLCLLAGSSDGTLRVLDDRSNNRTESSVKAHQSGIQGMQYNGNNFVYTIGSSLRWTLKISYVTSLTVIRAGKADRFLIPLSKCTIYARCDPCHRLHFPMGQRL